jgi:transposase-like protein
MLDPPVADPPDPSRPDWKRYVEHKGLACPYCGSNDLEAGIMDADGGYAWQPVTCNGCDREWQDRYKLVGGEPEDGADDNDDTPAEES